MPPNTTAPPQYGDVIFEKIDLLRNADGMVVEITRKKSNGQLSLRLAKEFERDGRTEYSSFFQRRQLDGAIEILKLARERMDQIIDAERASARQAQDERNHERRRTNGSRR